MRSFHAWCLISGALAAALWSSVGLAHPPVDKELLHGPTIKRATDPKPNRPSWRRSFNPDGIELVAFSSHAGGLVTWADGYELAEAGDEELPDVLKGSGLRLQQIGWGAGGGVRFNYQSTSGIRFSTGMSYHRLVGHALEHDALPPGVSLSLGDVGLFGAEIALGKAFDANDILPYVDLVARINGLFVSIETAIEPHGTVGDTHLSSVLVMLGPRLGLFIPLNDDLFIDVAVHGGLFGLERGGAQITLGFFDML